MDAGWKHMPHLVQQGGDLRCGLRGLPLCQVGLASGTFGLVMRLGDQSHTFQLLFADDLKMVAPGVDKEDRIWYMLVVWLMLGTPFKWPKFRRSLFGVCGFLHGPLQV